VELKELASRLVKVFLELPGHLWVSHPQMTVVKIGIQKALLPDKKLETKQYDNLKK